MEFKDIETRPPSFPTPLYYQFIRHPIYFGIILAVFSAPVMTTGRLLFSVVSLGYILVEIHFEERDLVAAHGEQYIAYRRRVRGPIPIR